MRKKIKEALLKRAKEGNLRILKLLDSKIDFSSNDYLGFARNEDIAVKFLTQLQTSHISMGSGGSRLLTGNSLQHQQLEELAADVFSAEAALYYSSGYMANVGLVSALALRNDTVLYDEAVHTSLKDGARLSSAKSFSFKHNDLESLEKKLKRHNEQSLGAALVLIESLYSMEGDYAKLKEIAALCKKYKAEYIIDEAHTTGLEGEGRGYYLNESINHQAIARVYTLGKAAGSSGAFVVADKDVADYLINFSRTFIYTTAQPVINTVAAELALKRLQLAHTERIKLDDNIKYFIKKFQNLENYKKCSGPIQIIFYSGNEKAKRLSLQALEQGIDIRAILSPTVKKGQERLRVCLHSYNSRIEIDKLAEVLQEK